MNGVAPDLIVHFGDLLWRAVGTVGGDEGIHTFENDTGPDDANHAQTGSSSLVAPGVEPRAPRRHAPARRRADRARAARDTTTPATMRGSSLVSESAGRALQLGVLES